MNPRELKRILDELTRPRLLIVGDLILDRYVTGEVERISPEAPIPVLAARHSEQRLGGAGNVAANLRAMEAEVTMIGVVGPDQPGDRLGELLRDIGIDSSALVTSKTRPTTQKTRMIGGVQQILRVDWEEVHPLTDDLAEEIIRGLEERLGEADAVILSDYGKGVLTREVTSTVIRLAAERGVPVLVDPKGTDFDLYKGATLVTPNRKEAEEAVRRRLTQHADYRSAADELIDTLELEAAVITLGRDGIFYKSQGERYGILEARVPTTARAVFDVTGAGDTVIAQLALGLAAGIGLEASVHLANHAAGLVVARRGAASVTREELKVILGEPRGIESRILRRDELPEVLAEWRAEGKRIVFTNGCFDILHAGHIDYLRNARLRGDVLIVGVNDDDSVRRLKGSDRPFNALDDRLSVLAALEMVSAVVPFSEDTPEQIVREITPAVLVKGQDWKDKGVVGREWVEKHGGQVFLAPLLPGRSTSALADRMRTAKDTRPV